jgi:hypothetical protein
MLLHDLYSFFRMPPSEHEGAGNFSILLVLLYIIDGISVFIYRTPKVDDQETRFKKLVRDRLHWGSTDNGWVEKGLAAKQMYLELRNPLVHELGADKVTSARNAGFLEPRISKWGNIDSDSHDIDLIEKLSSWNDHWPILKVCTIDRGSYIKVNGAALYWAVKNMIEGLVSDEAILRDAVDFQNKVPSD